MSSDSWLSERARNGGADEVPLPVGAGHLWLCGKHYVGPDVAAAMARTGATTVVCLNEAHELADRYPEYVAWLRASVSSSLAVWHPVPDLHAPPLPVARALVDDLADRLAGGASLLAHCGAGHGRAGTVAVGILLRLGASLDDALATVAAARPLAGPQSDVQTDLCKNLASGS